MLTQNKAFQSTVSEKPSHVQHTDLMKLWQGWDNTDQGRPYFHYVPFGVQRTDGVLAQTCEKKNMKKT